MGPPQYRCKHPHFPSFTARHAGPGANSLALVSESPTVTSFPCTQSIFWNPALFVKKSSEQDTTEITTKLKLEQICSFIFFICVLLAERQKNAIIGYTTQEKKSKFCLLTCI